MDETTNGLNSIVKRRFINTLLEDVAERGTTVIMSFHNLGGLERICDSIAIINNGEIKYSNCINCINYADYFIMRVYYVHHNKKNYRNE